MSASWEFQRVIFRALSDAPEIGIPVYDGRPKDRTYPSIEIGPSDFIPDDYECIRGREETVQIDVWSSDNGKLNRCKRIVDQVVDVLHNADLEMRDPYALVTMELDLARVFRDADGLTAHGLLQFTGSIETH